ncbi:MAG TPA: hypothetical protein VJ485_04370 [archaeon]|jgi:23S rRNA A1618 N6-methylase RlmF|nr:hypothetical protein [archaeon]
MKKEILMLDPKLIENKNFILGFATELLEAGYEICGAESLEMLHGKGKSLADYEIILTHTPYREDAKKIFEEMQKRKEFRVIVYGGNKIREYNDQEILRVRDSDQCYYCYVPEEGEIPKLIKEGW